MVTLDDEPLEDAVEDGPGDTTNTVGSLVAGLTLGHPLSADLDLGLGQVLVEVSALSTAELTNGVTSLRNNNIGLENVPDTSGDVILSTSVPSGSACSSRPLCLNFMLPKCMTQAVIL